MLSDCGIVLPPVNGHREIDEREHITDVMQKNVHINGTFAKPWRNETLTDLGRKSSSARPNFSL